MAAPSTTRPLTADSPLLRPLEIGRFEVPHRVLMAPLTRNRATGDVPNEMQAEYYAQRASAGLIISEGTQPARVGQGYPNVPGLHSDAQRAGWARIAERVHADGGHLFVQLMHAGRISHENTLDGAAPVAPSAVPADAEVVTWDSPDPTVDRSLVTRPHPTPRALALGEIPDVVASFARAARLAVDAGADGVEIHGANGYLVHQFLADGINHRTDAYGGSAEHRARFAVEVVRACVAEIGADRVGLRISPLNPFNDISESTDDVYDVLVAEIADLGLAYLHVVGTADQEFVSRLRRSWPGVYLLNTNFAEYSDRDDMERLVADGLADAVTVGRPWIANPDLVRRWREGAGTAEPDQATLYGGDAHGYTDYPTLDAA